MLEVRVGIGWHFSRVACFSHPCPSLARSSRRLLDRILGEDHLYVIHYDWRSPRAEHKRLRELVRSRPNVILQRPIAVNWGCYSIVRAQVAGMELALNSGARWTHWINLSGQCYSIRPVGQTAQWLQERSEQSFVNYFKPLESTVWKNPEDRLTLRHVQSHWLRRLWYLPGVGRRLRRLIGNEHLVAHWPGRMPMPTEFTWYGGDNWVVLSREACEHLLQDPSARRIHSRLKVSLIPHESVFQSVLMNSPLADRVTPRSLNLANWPPSGNVKSPLNFSETDFPRLQAAAASDLCFARKFDPVESGSLLDRIDRELLGR